MSKNIARRANAVRQDSYRDRKKSAGQHYLQGWIDEDSHNALLALLNMPEMEGKTRADVMSIALQRLRDSLI